MSYSIHVPVESPALTAGPFSRTCLTKMVSIGIMGSSRPADIPRCHSSGQSFRVEKKKKKKMMMKKKKKKKRKCISNKSDRWISHDTNIPIANKYTQRTHSMERRDSI